MIKNKTFENFGIALSFAIFLSQAMLIWLFWSLALVVKSVFPTDTVGFLSYQALFSSKYISSGIYEITKKPRFNIQTLPSYFFHNFPQIISFSNSLILSITSRT